MEIDNFDLIRSHLDFVDTKLDRYVVHILRRPKDLTPEYKNALGANESQRLIKTYYVDSVKYLDRKREAIKELCRANNARAYIIVQPKDNFECLLNLGQKILKTIQNKNYSVKPEHLIRQAYCECHKSRKKQWILDLDRNEMVETWVQNNYGGKVLCRREWTVSKVVELVKEELREIEKHNAKKKKKSKEKNCANSGKKLEDEVYVVPTKNGWHIVTPPFNLESARSKCGLLYEGVQKRTVDLKEYTLKPGDFGYAGSPGLDTKYREEKKDVVGWLHKDGMTILWMATEDDK